MDANDCPVTLVFAFVVVHSPLILSMNICQFFDTYNRTCPHSIYFKGPQYMCVHLLYIYINDDESGNQRIILQIVRNGKTYVQKLLD